MVGAGIFTTSGFSLNALGDRWMVMAAWAVGAVVALCGAISYGQLARQLTQSGGEYLFLSRFVHPVAGFLAGWVSLLAGFTGAIAFAAAALESYAIPASLRPDWLAEGAVGIGVIMACAGLHWAVVKVGIAAQNWVVTAKLFLLIGFIGFAVAYFPAGWDGLRMAPKPNPSTTPFSIFTFASTLVWISLSFSGFNAAIYVAGEVKQPERNVPLALLIGTLTVSTLYLILNYIFLFGPDRSAIDGVPNIAAAAANAIGGPSLAMLVRIIVCVSLLSSVSSMVMAGPRVYAKMAEDGLFPVLLGQANSRSSPPPHAALWMQAILASVVLYFASLRSLLDHLGFTLSVTAACTVASVFWTGKIQGSRPYCTQVLLIAAVYVFSTLALAAVSVIHRPAQLIGFAAAISSGLLLYRVMKR